MITRPSLRASLLVCTVLGVAGCSSTEKERDEQAAPAPTEVVSLFAPRADGIGTIQLHRTGDEASLPVLSLPSGQTLSLAFDLVREAGRPLSVYFYHADRSWRRDLVPAEFLESFHRDDLLDYGPSIGSQIPYTHYRYEFPNRSIAFRISGNYVVRVTEQGMEDDVLFERPFYVSEQATPIDLSVGNVMVAGSPVPYLQPTLSFTPPNPAYGNAFDYTVCFQRNGLLDDGRCTDDASLAMVPQLTYYLEPEEAFGPRITEHFLDISEIRVGGRVERADLQSDPFRLVLEPDYIRFPGAIGVPLLNGNPVVEGAVTSLNDPARSADYVQVDFALVPENDVPVRGDVWVLGSFNDWEPRIGNRMEFNEERRRYEGSALLKQGRYEYRYGFENASVRRQVAYDSPLASEGLLTAFMYFSDIRVSTDRLITAATVRSW